MEALAPAGAAAAAAVDAAADAVAAAAAALNLDMVGKARMQWVGAELAATPAVSSGQQSDQSLVLPADVHSCDCRLWQ